MLAVGRWYAVQVRPRLERSVSRLLEERGYEQLLPTYKCRRRSANRFKELELPLFPSYVFCRITATAAAPIVTTPGVVRIVGAGNQPVAVDDSEMDALQRAVKSRFQLEACSFLRVGQKVRIESGPLSGIEGILSRVRNVDRLVVSVTLLHRSVSVEIHRDCVLELGGRVGPLPLQRC